MKNYCLEKDIDRLLKEIKSISKNKENANYILENTYFLKDGRVLSLPRQNGVSRFPYGTDGFTLWAYSSGYISINESTFYLVLPSEEGKEPYLAFYGGEKQKDGRFVPISIMGRASNPLEGDNVKRYVIYSKECVYYITETIKAVYAVRIYVTDNKEVAFTTLAKNKTNKNLSIYLSAYLNCLFKYANRETMETKWFKKCTYQNNTFSFESPEDLDRKTHVNNYGVVHREYVDGKPSTIHNTTGRAIYMGAVENGLINSVSLRNGYFDKEKDVTHFTDTAISGDINHYSLKPNETVKVNYVLTFTHDDSDYVNMQQSYLSYVEVEKLLKEKMRYFEKRDASKNMMSINFEDWKDSKIDTKVLNQFIKYVIYQTEYCGLAKNSGTMFLGVRDVMQQIDAALMWNAKACRKKIIEVLSFIDSTGNPPRQYSIPPKGATPLMDLRDFIDQGVWIISTIYNYLAYTGDYRILNEKTGYYDRVPGGVVLSKRVDSVLDHMIQVMDYLVTHIDENTGCLRAMYGDWNDALDGLGITHEKGKEYGDGVSVMATLQLYMNLREMKEILTKIDVHPELVALYSNKEEQIRQGIKKYAVVSNGTESRICHGWGEHRSYYVGTFNDVDGVNRYSSTSNAFYVISNMFKEGYVSKEDIVNVFKHLDSKYGIKTFEPYFKPDCKGVGRIVNLPKGTAENGATYIHGALFGTLALFMLNEGEMAYGQIEKLLPITHSILTTTPFVMPNSYSYNVEEDMDGQSMSDWYTGSANTLIKTLVKGSFGVFPSLDGLKIEIRDYFPSKSASLKVKVRNTNVNITYKDSGAGERKILVNGIISEKTTLLFDYEYLNDNREIKVEIID